MQRKVIFKHLTSTVSSSSWPRPSAQASTTRAFKAGKCSCHGSFLTWWLVFRFYTHLDILCVGHCNTIINFFGIWPNICLPYLLNFGLFPVLYLLTLPTCISVRPPVLGFRVPCLHISRVTKLGCIKTWLICLPTFQSCERLDWLIWLPIWQQPCKRLIKMTKVC